MKRLTVLFSAVLLGMVLGCGGRTGSSNDEGNKYLKNCRAEEREDGTLAFLADVELPADHIGLIYVSGDIFSGTVVFESGTVQLKVLPADATGVYEYCLRLIRTLDPDFRFVPGQDLTNLTGITECCSFQVGEEEDPEEPPEEPPEPEEPILVCNVNIEGHVSVVISLGAYSEVWLDCEELYESPIVLYEDYAVLETELPPGFYTFRLLFDLEGVIECTLEIPELEPPDDDDDHDDYDDDDDHDGDRRKKRYWVCFKGRCKYLPYKAYLRHLELGATPGPCDRD